MTGWFGCRRHKGGLQSGRTSESYHENTAHFPGLVRIRSLEELMFLFELINEVTQNDQCSGREIRIYCSLYQIRLYGHVENKIHL